MQLDTLSKEIEWGGETNTMFLVRLLGPLCWLCPRAGGDQSNEI